MEIPQATAQVPVDIADEKPIRMAFGIIPDACAVIQACEKLLASGCNSHQLYLLGQSPIGSGGQEAGRFSLRWVSPVAGISTWTPARWCDFQRADSITISTIERYSCVVRQFVDASHIDWWEPYTTCIAMGNTIMIILLNNPWQEIVFGKTLLAHSIGRFQTVSLT